MKYERKNWSLRQPDLRDGDEVVGCNLFQAARGTKIAVGVKHLVFRQCNLVNCVLPEDARVEDCNTAQRDPDPPQRTVDEIEAERLAPALAEINAALTAARSTLAAQVKDGRLVVDTAAEVSRG